MSIMVYMIKVSLGIFLFYLVYRLVFRRFTFYGLNRILILVSGVGAFLLPFFRIPAGAGEVNGFNEVIPIDWNYFEILTSPTTVEVDPGSAILLPALMLMAVLSISFIRFLLLIYRYLRVVRTYSGGEIREEGGIRWIVHPAVKSPFTLFRTVYLDRYTSEQPESVVRQHEEVHARQLHSLDLVFWEVISAFLWFNPFVFLFKRLTRENHEYLADDVAQASGRGLESYLRAFAGELARKHDPVFASHFKSSTIKKRIIMLTNKKTKQNKKWYYLLVVPLTAFLALAFQQPLEEMAEDVPGLRLQSALHSTVPDRSGPAAPDRFPLDEKFRKQVSLDYGWTGKNPVTGKKMTHRGVDFRAPLGSTIYAAGNGVVSKSEFDKRYGKVIVINHGTTYTTLYSHLDGLEVSIGEKVAAGQRIGTVGSTGVSTGPHLHFEVRRDGEPVDPSAFY